MGWRRASFPFTPTAAAPSVRSPRRARRIALPIVALALAAARAEAGDVAAERRAPEPTGFVVVAPDRGFLGNDLLEETFASFARGHRARLVFVTDERTRARLCAALSALTTEGAKRIAVLPLVLSDHDPRLRLVRDLLGAGGCADGLAVTTSAPFGASYLAVEALGDSLRKIEHPAGSLFVIAGYGATDPDSRRGIEEDLQGVAVRAAQGFGFNAVRALAFYDAAAPDQEARRSELVGDFFAAAGFGLLRRVAVVPWQLGPCLDTMMCFGTHLRSRLPARYRVIDTELASSPLVQTWLEREANRHSSLRLEDVGVILLAHGADHEWNETMREAASSLAGSFKMEPAFSMADPLVVERAVRRLEARGARAIVVIRVFGLTESFAAEVERMLGLDIEPTRGEHHAASHGAPGQASAGHDHGAGGGPVRRIRSSALFATVGGLDDHPLFAQALLERARGLSLDPSRETLILVAHGYGDDALDRQWRSVLERLARWIAEHGGNDFRAIRTGTWREDWPERREPEIAAIRAIVEEAGRDGGRAIVIPARTAGGGREREFLAGLEFALGAGFAPSTEFEQWLDATVRTGIEALGIEPPQTSLVTAGQHAH